MFWSLDGILTAVRFNRLSGVHAQSRFESDPVYGRPLLSISTKPCGANCTGSSRTYNLGHIQSPCRAVASIFVVRVNGCYTGPFFGSEFSPVLLRSAKVRRRIVRSVFVAAPLLLFDTIARY